VGAPPDRPGRGMRSGRAGTGFGASRIQWRRPAPSSSRIFHFLLISIFISSSGTPGIKSKIKRQDEDRRSRSCWVAPPASRRPGVRGAQDRRHSAAAWEITQGLWRTGLSAPCRPKGAQGAVLTRKAREEKTGRLRNTARNQGKCHYSRTDPNGPNRSAVFEIALLLILTLPLPSSS